MGKIFEETKQKDLSPQNAPGVDFFNAEFGNLLVLSLASTLSWFRIIVKNYKIVTQQNCAWGKSPKKLL